MEMMVVYRYLVGRNTPIPPGLNLPTVSIIQPAHGALGYYCYCYDLKETRLSILLLLSGHLFLLNGWLLLLVFHFIPLLLQLNWEKIRQHFNISGCYWKSICFSISASMLLPAKSDNSPSFLPTIVYREKSLTSFCKSLPFTFQRQIALYSPCRSIGVVTIQPGQEPNMSYMLRKMITSAIHTQRQIQRHNF